MINVLSVYLFWVANVDFSNEKQVFVWTQGTVRKRFGEYVIDKVPGNA